VPEQGDEINRRIAEIRKKLGFTQLEFAQGLKISKSHVFSIESGRRSITDNMVQRICFTYGANERWLKTGEGEMFTDFEDSRRKRILENFNKLSPFMQDIVLKQLDFALEIQQKMDGSDAAGAVGEGT
jgi:transcriptional regulator with XRE-family HTH domain